MIYPVVVKKISIFPRSYFDNNKNDTRYVAFSPMTETIFAVSDTIQGVLKKISAEFALRVFDPLRYLVVKYLPGLSKAAR